MSGFSASCVTLNTIEQVIENATTAARRFEPLKLSEIHELRDAVLASNPTMCPGCDGRCSVAGGTKARLGDLARFYTYHEDHGIRSVAREEYAALTAEERDWPRGPTSPPPAPLATTRSTSPGSCPRPTASSAD